MLHIFLLLLLFAVFVLAFSPLESEFFCWFLFHNSFIVDFNQSNFTNIYVLKILLRLWHSNSSGNINPKWISMENGCTTLNVNVLLFIFSDKIVWTKKKLEKKSFFISRKIKREKVLMKKKIWKKKKIMDFSYKRT